MTLPRVVGLMATRNRPALAHRAAHNFVDQDYAGDRHLLVFDDGDDRFIGCERCAPMLEIVHTPPVRLPTKRNNMMRHVGDHHAFYVQWDDDDYHGPTRISRQVDVLVFNEGCLLRPTLYYSTISNEIRTSTWKSDATMAYRWEFWARRNFVDSVDPGSGALFIANRGSSLVELDALLDYMVVVHLGQRHTPPAFGEPHFTTAPVPASWAQERLQLG